MIAPSGTSFTGTREHIIYWDEGIQLLASGMWVEGCPRLHCGAGILCCEGPSAGDSILGSVSCLFNGIMPVLAAIKQRMQFSLPPSCTWPP